MIKKPIIPHHTTMVIVLPFSPKSELFKSFFAEQCSILQDSSKRPTNLALRTDQSLTSTNFSKDDI